MLTSGPLAPFFWIEVIGCIIAAVICFVPSLRKTPALVVAALLAIVGIFCKRFQILDGGFQINNFADYGMVLTPTSVTNWTDGMAGAYAGLVYTPSMLELGITVGVLGLGALLLLLGLKFLPLKPVED